MAFNEKEFAKQFTTNSTKSSFDVNKFASNFQTTQKQNTFDLGKFTSQFGKSDDIKTSEGLYNLASHSGLQKQADQIIKSQSGEKTKEIFSGGFISDIFDVMSAAQYGVTGMLKGKTFSEGVKTRQSFTDKDALGDKGIPGLIGGLILDIAVDPLTYIAPWTLFKKIPGAVKVVKLAQELAIGKRVTKAIEGTGKTFETLEGGTQLGKYLGQKFTWMFGADPVFKETFERGLKNTAISTQVIADMGKAVSNLTPETATKLLRRDETGRFARVGIDELQKILKPDEFETVGKLYNKIDSLGGEAVDLGLLSQSKYEENIGQYLKNAYTEYEKSKGLFGGGKVGIKGIKGRVEGLTPEKMAELGQIDNPAYLLFKSAFDLSKDVENAKLLKEISQKFGTDIAQGGFEKIPAGIKYGQLASKYVPQNMAEYIKEIIPPQATGILEQFGKDTMGNFKFFKVVMNPATHARNIISNKLLNYWKLGMNPLDPRVIANDIEALKEIAKGTGKWINEAKPHGYNLNTFASQEMKHILDLPEANLLNKGNKGWQTMKKKLGDIYQSEENFAKLSAFIWNRKKGLGSEAAWKAAESATFNYAQVTPFIRKLRESAFGMPFITFTVKSTPLAIETALKHPQRIGVIGKIKQAIENASDIKETDRERASEPEWVKNGFYIKLPTKDKEGRSAYFDLTYILPFGDLMSGAFFQRGTERKTGLPESGASALMGKSPTLSLIKELAKNQDFYGNKIWKTSDSLKKQTADMMRHISKTFLPPPIASEIPGGYNEKGERQQRGFLGTIGKDIKGTQQRNLMEEMLRNIGMKIQPIDADIQETYQEWNKKKALQNLLIENGVLDEFTRTYKPKS